MLLEVIRLEQNQSETLGVLKLNGEVFCLTLERPWKMNERNISCIPEGTYTCKRYSSPSHPNTFEVQDVHGRSYILFHKGNTVKDVSGCIALGSLYGTIGSDRAVLDSTRAFRMFMDATSGLDTFTLVIKGV